MNDNPTIIMSVENIILWRARLTDQGAGKALRLTKDPGATDTACTRCDEPDESGNTTYVTGGRGGLSFASS